jgi:2-polyprenyl-3-methyl-5-hydroxy-6-metoxy-1,4-benzoquinol methylase|tara:strand:+ start:2112 stop:3506 length:1395 start_codon:yes stop_codon:yes gene_type:complete
MIEEELEGEWTDPPVAGGLPVSDEVFISNIRENCKRDLPNLNTEYEHDKIMVMVCGGASAQHYLKEIKAKSNDPKYDIFCSNLTHDWLVENKITPDYFFMIDPKKEKANDVKQPLLKTKYLIGAQCDKGVFDNLKDYNVTRILTYCGISNGNSITDTQIINAFFDAKTFAPLEGGTMAGLRAMPLANIMGYRTVEFYGFDSCFYDKNEKGEPIYYSYEKKRKENIIEAKTDDGTVFQTTPVFASQARQFIKWKHRLAWISFIIHGDSLTKKIHELDDIQQTPSTMAMISPYMMKMNEELHKRKGYGASHAGAEHAGKLSVLIGQLLKKQKRLSMLDYGCGKGELVKMMPPITGVGYRQYDPCVEEFANKPDPADVVCCVDVLEHIEPLLITNVLNHLKKLTKKILYISVATVEAKKFYADGKNTHLIVEDFKWWYPQLRKRFNIIETMESKTHFTCVLQAKEVK